MNSNVTPFFLLILAIALFYVYVNPEYAKINTLRTQQAQYADALDKVQQIQQIRDSLLTKYNNFSPDDLNKLETMLPDRVDTVRLALDLSNMASQYGFSIGNIKVQEPLDASASQNDASGKAKPYDSLTMTFSADTTYGNFTEFLKDIEQSLEILDVTNITANPEQGDTYLFTTTVQAYWLK